MIYRFLADAVVTAHLLFIIFALFGGLLLLWRIWAIFLHLPTAVWACLVEFNGWICPLTPMENWLRFKSGEQGYGHSFVEQYLIPIIYPSGLTPSIQVVLGTIALLVNLVVYWYVFWQLRRKRKNRFNE